MKGVILAAGYATRFLPASKTIPKEMFPLIDVPAIDLIVREMVDSGIKDILLVSSRRKKAMEDYFDREVELTASFTEMKAEEKLQIIEPINANIFTLRQQYMMGTGNALMLVRPFVKDEPFIVAYPDDLVIAPTPLSKQLMDAYEQRDTIILAVQDLPGQDVSRYGVIRTSEEGTLVKVDSMVEKPAKGTEPSHLVSYGRYLYTPDIFDALSQSDDAYQHQREFTQTEAINLLASQGRVSALKFIGKRYDIGEPLGYVKTTIELALQRKGFREELIPFLKELLSKEDPS